MAARDTVAWLSPGVKARFRRRADRVRLASEFLGHDLRVWPLPGGEHPSFKGAEKRDGRRCSFICKRCGQSSLVTLQSDQTADRTMEPWMMASCDAAAESRQLVWHWGDER